MHLPIEFNASRNFRRYFPYTLLDDVAVRVLPKSETIQLEELRRTLQMVQDFFAQSHAQIQDTAGIMQQATSSFNEAVNTTVVQLQQIATDLGQFSATLSQTYESTLNAIGSALNRLSESIDGLRIRAVELSELHNDLAAAHGRLLDVYAHSAEELRRVEEERLDLILNELRSVTNSLEASRHLVEQWESTVMETLQRLTDAQEETLRRVLNEASLTQNAQATAERLQALIELTQRATMEYSGYIRSMGQLLHEILMALRNLNR